MKSTPDILEVPEAGLNHPFVVSLLEKSEHLLNRVEQLESEIRLLKSHAPYPVIPPRSNLEPAKDQPNDGIKKTPFTKRAKKSD